MKVGVIDYGVGNLGSVLRALEELRVATMQIRRAQDLGGADALILPGVGNFADCIALLRAGGWDAALRDQVLGHDRPLLGVCVGMQLLADSSTERLLVDGSAAQGDTPGLGFIPGRVRHLRELGSSLRLPQAGWNSIVRTQRGEAGLFRGISDGTDFYFSNSYAFVPTDPADVSASVDYGIRFAAAVHRGRVWGTQFHPEKSSRAGFALLRNFIDGEGAC